MKRTTAKQQAVLDYIGVYLSVHGVTPTYKEISDHFNFSSPNGAYEHVGALNRKGLLTLGDYGSPRGIRLPVKERVPYAWCVKRTINGNGRLTFFVDDQQDMKNIEAYRTRPEYTVKALYE